MTLRRDRPSRVAEVAAAPARGSRLAHVQGLRAVAVTAVVAYHAGHLVPGGFLGVDVFFTISGYVIVAMLLREADARGTVSLGTFYARRVRRLVPALALMIVTVLVLSTFLQSPIGTEAGQDLTARTAIGALFISANVVLYQVPIDGYFANRALNNPLLHTWSLSVEEQFYLVVPALVVAGAWWARRRSVDLRRVLAVALGLMLVLSFALGVVTSYGTSLPGVASPAGFAFYSPATRAWEFCIGALLATWLAGRRGRVTPGLSTACGVVGAALVVAAFVTVGGDDAVPGVVALLPTLGTAGLILAGLAPGPVRTALAWRPLVRIGDLSYSWYLWHWPVIVLSGIVATDAGWGSGWVPVAAGLASLAPAYLSLRFVENPIRERRLVATMSARRLAAWTTIGTVLVAGVLLGGARSGWGREDVRALSIGMSDHTVGQVSGCFSDTAMDDAHTEACTFGPAAADTRILLVGDSHAESFSDAVVTASPTSRVTVLTMGACPFLELPGDPVSDLCRDRNAYVMDLIEQQPPDVLVLGQLTLGYLGVDNGEAMLRTQRTELERVTSDLGVPVLLVGDVPPVGLNGNPCRFGPVLGPRCYVDRGATEDRVGAARDYERALVDGIGRTAFVDTWDELCDDERCLSARGDVLGYLDGDHLTRSGSGWLAPLLRDPLAELVAS